MIHYSCDRCKRPISGQDAIRYVVKMEIEATMDIDSDNADASDRDALHEIDEMLDNLNTHGIEECDQPLFERRRFDLCPDCYREFAKNPLSREKLVPFGFSKN